MSTDERLALLEQLDRVRAALWDAMEAKMGLLARRELDAAVNAISLVMNDLKDGAK